MKLVQASRPVLVASILVACAGCAETVTDTPAGPDAAVVPPVECPVDPGAPLMVSHATDRGTVTLNDPTIPLDADETAFNAMQPPGEGDVAWAMSSLSVGTGSVIFYGSYLVRPGYLNFQGLGVGIARQAAPDAPVVRDRGLLFAPPVPGFSSGAIAEGETVYAYECNIAGFLDAECRVASAPMASLDEASSWTVWDGTTWNADLSTGVVIVTGMNGMSTTYNRHLGRYLAVYGGILNSNVYVRTTVRPEGPWSEPVLAFTGLQAGDGHMDYNAAQRPELEPADGCTVVITYVHPTSATAVETREVDVGLQ